MNAAARLIFSSSRFNHITPLLHQLHWLKASKWIAFMCAVLLYKCLHGSPPSYLVDELSIDRCRGSSATLRCLVFITDHRPHLTIHRRGSSLSDCHCLHLEQFTPACHFCTFIACLLVTPQDPSFYYFLSQSLTMYSAFAVTLVMLNTLIVHVIYLLTLCLCGVCQTGTTTSTATALESLTWSSSLTARTTHKH